jgi:hypothetical protein
MGHREMMGGWVTHGGKCIDGLERCYGLGKGRGKKAGTGMMNKTTIFNTRFKEGLISLCHSVIGSLIDSRKLPLTYR